VKTSSSGIEFIKKWEGSRLNPKTRMHEPYKCCAGLLTIGYGHLIKPGEDFGAGIDEERAIELLKGDLSAAENAVSRLVPCALPQNQFDALVSLVFNIGAGAFAKSTIRKYLNDTAFGSPEYPSKESAWKAFCLIGGKQSAGLSNRRNAEWDMYSA